MRSLLARILRGIRELIDFLYQASRAHRGTGELDAMLRSLLIQAQEMFGAEIAEVLLLPDGEQENAYRSRLGPRPFDQIMKAVGRPQWAAAYRAVIVNRHPAILPREEASALGLGDGSDLELRDCMLSALRGESGVIGTIMVANRFGTMGFDQGHLDLFAALAGHASVALEKGRLQQRFRHLAFHDGLTNLANRSLFLDRIDHALKRRERLGAPAILYLDLDDFKTINDSLGHATGDQLLVSVAERLRGCLRPHDTAARLGGDEFGILLDDVLSEEAAVVVADRIQEALGPPFEIGSEEVHINASIGMVFSHGRDDAAEELLRSADLAMYTAKSQGKSRCAIFEPQMTAAVVRRHALKADLRRATSRGEFSLVFQPWIDLRSGRMVAAEALVRWLHPTRGTVGPCDFIPLAEETGMILAIGRQVLQEACHATRSWQQLHPDHRSLAVSVNISPRQLQETTFVDEVREVLAQARLHPSRLILEITEGVMMQESEAVINRLRRLRSLGVRLAVDDFGTGYSSLSRLQHLPIDILKIAQPFIDDLVGDPDKIAFLSAILKLGSTLRLQMVAEGIESVGQETALRSLGCNLAQGFLFARPMRPAEIGQLLGADQLTSVS